MAEGKFRAQAFQSDERKLGHVCRGDLLPEATQVRDALGRRVARNDGRVNGANANPGDRVGV